MVNHQLHNRNFDSLMFLRACNFGMMVFIMYDCKIAVEVWILFKTQSKGFSLMNEAFSLPFDCLFDLIFTFIVPEFIRLFVQDAVSYQRVLHTLSKENLVVLNLPYWIVKGIDRRQFESHIFVRRIVLPFNNFFV